VFAAASTAGPASTGEQTALLLAGVGLGSLTWVSALAVAVALARRRAGPRLLRAVDGGAGMGLVGFGGLLGWRTLHD
jgi:putative LysE/RhtB family amino acid efflux pump